MHLDPDAAGFLRAVQTANPPAYETLTPAAARAAYAAGRAATMPPSRTVAEVRDLAAEGAAGPIPVRLYRPQGPEAGPLPGLIYFHGGGWVLGDLDTHDGVCRHLAAASGCCVLAVEYRLAPEHKFPAAIDDAVAATRWAFTQAGVLGLDPSRLAVGGDSAGGTLAAVTCLVRRDAGEPPPRLQLLLYPVTDMDMQTSSHEQFAEGFLLTRASLAWFAGHYLRGPEDRADWRASPLKASTLAALPAAFIVTAGHDPLRDEGEAYAARLLAAGVRVTAWRIPGQIHGFLPMGRVMSCAAPVLDTIARHMTMELCRQP